MSGLRGWIIFAWIALPTVMYGGYSLIRLINRGNVLTPVQGKLFPGGPRSRGRADADVAVVLHFFGPNIPSFVGQACSVCGHRRRHPRSIGRLLYPPDPGTGVPRYQSNSDGCCHFGLCHWGSYLWPDQHALKS